MSDLVADDISYITYESSAGPEYGDGCRHCLTRAVNEHCTLREEVRQRSDRVWEGEGVAQHREGGVAARVHFTDQYQ